MPVGTEKIRNQKKTSEGMKPACAPERLRSAFTKLVAEPTRSTNPMAKKQSITGIICIMNDLRSVATVFVAVFGAMLSMLL